MMLYVQARGDALGFRAIWPCRTDMVLWLMGMILMERTLQNGTGVFIEICYVSTFGGMIKCSRSSLLWHAFSERRLASVFAVFKRYQSTDPCDLDIVRPHSLDTLENQKLSASVLHTGSIHVKIDISLLQNPSDAKSYGDSTPEWYVEMWWNPWACGTARQGGQTSLFPLLAMCWMQLFSVLTSLPAKTGIAGKELQRCF